MKLSRATSRSKLKSSSRASGYHSEIQHHCYSCHGILSIRIFVLTSLGHVVEACIYNILQASCAALV